MECFDVLNFQRSIYQYRDVELKFKGHFDELIEGMVCNWIFGF